MHETSEQTASPARSRISPAALASVVVGGVLSVSWGVVSILMLVTGLSALPALGSGLLLLIPWLLLMQGAVRIEQRRAVAVHGIGVNLPARRRSHRTGAAGWLQDRWFELGSGAFWRGVLHHHLAMLTAGAFLLVALALLWLGWSGWELALLRGPVGIGGLELSRWSLAGIGTVALVLCAVVLALGALAARSRIPVVLDVSLLGPGHAGLDREREGVAYFVVAEALTNIAKHAEAEQVAVTVRQEPGTLRVRIEDDGRGGALVRRDGLSTGLAGLTDRVRAAGGVLEILSPRGGGTVLEAVLPLPTSSPPPRPSAQPSVRSETRDQTLEVPR